MACCCNLEYAKLGYQGQEEFEQTVMQRPNADSIYYDEFLQFQEKLQKREEDAAKRKAARGDGDGDPAPEADKPLHHD